MHRISNQYKRHHAWHYSILFLILSTGFFSFTKTLGQPQKMLTIGVVVGSAYALWGIFHHLEYRDLNWKIVVEYSAIAILAIAMLWMLLSYTY